MAISDTITSMYENVGEVYDTITNVTLPEHKNIENIPSTIRESYLEIMNNGIDVIWDNWEKVVGEGTSLTLSNTEEAPMKVLLKGNTYQDSTTGKNLLNDTTAKMTVPDVQGSLTTVVNMTISAGTYRFGCFVDGQFVSTSNIYSFLFRNGQTIIKGTGAPTSTITLTQEEAEQVDNVLLYYNPNFVSTYKGEKITGYMLVSGSTLGDYEPYTNGASPNPYYPQEVHVVSGDNEVEVKGKNLFNYASTNYIENYPTTLTGTGENFSISSNDTTGLRVYYIGKANFPTLYAYMSSTYSSGSLALYATNSDSYNTWNDFYNDRTPVQNNWNITQMSSVNLSNYQGKHLWLSMRGSYSGGGYSSVNYKDFILSKTSVSAYEPYKGTTYPINLPVENLLNATVNKVEAQANQTVTTTIGQISMTQGTTYYISYTVENNNTSNTRNTPRLNSSGTSTNYYENSSTNYNLTKGRKVWAFNCETTGTYNLIYWIQGANTSITVDDFMISTIRTEEYTPYGTTPIELCSIGDYKDRFFKTSGKNLFDESTMVAGKNIDSSGVYGDYSQACASEVYIPVKPNTTYNYCVSTSSYTPNIAKYTSDKTFIERVGNTTTNKLTFTTGTNCYYIRLRLYLAGTTATQELVDNINFWLTEGTTALPYEPYGTNEWYLEKKIGKVVLDGSEDENYTYQSGNNGFTLNNYETPFSNRNLNVYDGYCNYFSVQKNSSTWAQVNYCGWNTNNVFWFKDNGAIATSVEDLRNWLSTHNTEVYYVLATPTYTKIEGTLASQLEEVYRAKSYKNETNISQSNNDLPFVLSVSALKEI